ncbi:MAG: DUF4118 domain-containing protein [Peptococcaceae bacterium]|nr:DUF4118 domain-containing protein [Peptococcaceae bacterium]
MNRIGKNVTERLAALEEYLAARQRRASAKSAAYHAGVMLALLAAATAAGYLFHGFALRETDIAIMYLLAVLLTARLTDGYLYGFLASLLAAFLFNFLFTEPFAFSVDTQRYIVPFLIMVLAALITSTLTTQARENALEAREKEAGAKILYTLTTRLTEAEDIRDIAAIATGAISDMLSSNAGCLCFDENGKPEGTFIQQVSPKKQVRREVTAAEAEALRGRTAGGEPAGTAGSEFYDWPVYGRDTILGLIRVPQKDAKGLKEPQVRLLQAMIESTALAMDRLRAARQKIKFNEEIAQERYRGTLLRSISHDLRTPLSGIMGTSEMLLDMTEKEDQRYPLMEGIHKDAHWLHSLVENILSLTRLQDGKLMLNKQEEAAEEVIGAAVRHISRRYPEYEIAVDVPEELLLVPMDAKLIEQVLVNLLDNAAKHTAPQEEIRVSVIKDEEKSCAVFSVRDSGEGIAPEELANIFRTFYTSPVKHADAQPGIGLGLAICDAAVKAHGGSITACNRGDRPGAELTFTLPLEVKDDEFI